MAISPCVNRSSALLGSAAGTRSFQATMKALEDLSGYDEADVKAALIVEDDADQPGGEVGRLGGSARFVWSQSHGGWTKNTSMHI